MYTNITKSEFIGWFQSHRPNNFSYKGLKALNYYLESLEEDLGEEINFDPIALCCEYTEYSDIEEFNENYNHDCKTLVDIEEYTTVIQIENSSSFIIQNF
jgi:hypothetical protein